MINLMNDESKNIQSGVAPGEQDSNEASGSHDFINVPPHSGESCEDVRPVVEPKDEDSNLSEAGKIGEDNQVQSDDMMKCHLNVVTVPIPKDMGDT
jgi:hypothetical protein